MKKIRAVSYYPIKAYLFDFFQISNDVFEPEKLPLMYPDIYDYSKGPNRANMELTKPSAYKIFFMKDGFGFEGFISGRDLENAVCDMYITKEKKERPERYLAYVDITVYETPMHNIKSFKIQNDYWDKGDDRFTEIIIITKDNEVYKTPIDVNTLAYHFVYPTKHNR